MNIEQTSSIRFGQENKGIVLDDAYDIYKRNRYVDFVNKNQIVYIQSRDVDMRLLSNFHHIKYLTVPEEAEFLESLACLRELRGLEITAQCLLKVNLDWFPQLDCIVIHGQPHERIQCNTINSLYCIQWTMKDLSCLSDLRELKFLCLDFCSRLETLQGIEHLSELQELNLDYCLHLKDIDCIAGLSDSLKKLVITDCNAIKDFNGLKNLGDLETLYLTRFQTQGTGKIASLKFLDYMSNLKYFMTNYRINDNDLQPLLRLKDATILKYFSGYNVAEHNLPHGDNI